MAVDRFGALIGEAKEDDARLVQDSECEDVAKVEVECQDDARMGASTINQLDIWRALQTQRPDMNRFVSQLYQEVDGPRRDTGVGQKPHPSCTSGMQFVLCQGRSVGERLSDVLWLEI